jgi:phage FluMu protein Com
MTNDIFDNQILCKKCGKVMKPALVNRNGFNLRTIRCEKCNETIVHPADRQEYEEFMRLKQKEFNVKMRMVGNSYAVSIPREIVDFMHEQENVMNNMVRMCFEEAGRISLKFNTPEMNEESENNAKSRVVSAKEVKIVRNGKPVLHARKFYDSAHPERSQNKIFKDEKLNEETPEEEN